MLFALLIVLISAVPVAYTVTYAMHCLLVVVQDTAAGNDEVTWPAESFQDSLGGALHLVAVVLIWLALFGVLARALKDVLLPDNFALRFLLLAIPGLWLFLPVALLSSLSASSRWFVFRPVVVWNLLRLAPSTFIVYILSALLAGLLTALAYVTVFRGWLVAAPVAAAATATALLIYGRLLGRLGWTMGRLYVAKEKRIKKARSQARAALPREAAVEPSAPLGPEEVDSEWETTPYGQKRRRVKGYGMTRDALAESSPSEKSDSESEVTSYGQKRRRTKSYGITKEPAPSSDAAPEEGVTSLNLPPPASITDRPRASEPTDFERIIRANRRRLVESKRSFLGGVFSFPWYRQSRAPWLLLSLGFLMVYGLAYVMISFYLAVYKGG
jgi:hypothetical protein